MPCLAYCLYLMCSLFDFIRRRCDYKSGFLCRLTSWKGAGYVVLMDRVSVTILYSFRCLTTETVKYINENSFIENLAASKYSMWHREANKCRLIINNKCTFCMFRRSELPCPVKKVCVSKLLDAKKEKYWNLVFLCFFFMCLKDINKFFEKHLWPLKHVYSSCSMLTMVSLIINIYCIEHPFLSMPMLIRVLKTWKVLI